MTPGEWVAGSRVTPSEDYPGPHTLHFICAGEDRLQVAVAQGTGSGPQNIMNAAGIARARNRWPLYLELAREVAKSDKLPPGVWFALSALAPAPEVPDAHGFTE